MQPLSAKQLYKNVIMGIPVYCFLQTTDETHPTKKMFSSKPSANAGSAPSPTSSKPKDANLPPQTLCNTLALGICTQAEPANPLACSVLDPSVSSSTHLSHGSLCSAGTAGVAAGGYGEQSRANTALILGNKPVTHFFICQNSCKME